MLTGSVECGFGVGVTCDGGGGVGAGAAVLELLLPEFDVVGAARKTAD